MESKIENKEIENTIATIIRYFTRTEQYFDNNPNLAVQLGIEWYINKHKCGERFWTKCMKILKELYLLKTLSIQNVCDLRYVLDNMVDYYQRTEIYFQNSPELTEKLFISNYLKKNEVGISYGNSYIQQLKDFFFDKCKICVELEEVEHLKL